MAVAFGVARARSIDRTERRSTALTGSAANDGNIVNVGREFRNHGYINSGAYGGDNFADHVGILAHGHPIARGMRARQIEFQTVSNGCELGGDVHKFLNRAAKNGYQ